MCICKDRNAETDGSLGKGQWDSPATASYITAFHILERPASAFGDEKARWQPMRRRASVGAMPTYVRCPAKRGPDRLHIRHNGRRNGYPHCRLAATFFLGIRSMLPGTKRAYKVRQHSGERSDGRHVIGYIVAKRRSVARTCQNSETYQRHCGYLDNT